MKLAVHGATGRMGKAIVRLAREGGDFEVVGAVAAADAPEQGRDVGEVAGVGAIGVAVTADPAAGVLGADVVIDFSAEVALAGIVRAAARAKIALVSGTTGIGERGQRELDEAAKVVPVLWAPNMSLGMEVLASLARSAVERLGPDWDVEIVETHHRGKVDAPSGTAMRLAEAVRQARPELVTRHGREGAAGPRKAEEMGVTAIRGSCSLTPSQPWSAA